MEPDGSLSGLCTSGMMDPPPILRFYCVVCDNWPRGPVGYSEKFWGVCAAPVFATIPLAIQRPIKGQNRTLDYGKWVKIKPLTMGNVTKLTTFEAILHEIDQIWPKSCHLLRKKWWHYVKMEKNCWKYDLGYGTSAKIRPLAMEI